MKFMYQKRTDNIYIVDVKISRFLSIFGNQTQNNYKNTHKLCSETEVF